MFSSIAIFIMIFNFPGSCISLLDVQEERYGKFFSALADERLFFGLSRLNSSNKL
jgi:hypothetical protein